MSVERPRPLVAGNWKMNGLRASLDVLKAVQAGFGGEQAGQGLVVVGHRALRTASGTVGSPGKKRRAAHRDT